MTGALLSLALLVPSLTPAAAASTAPSAYVRVEGAGATLLPQTLVHATRASTIKGKSCSGSTAAGALDQGTAGNWSGSYSTSFKDYLVSSILGESPAGNNFWSLWVNGRSSQTGGCATQLHPGDHVLWFDCQADASFNCTNDPLALSAPASGRRGRPVTLSVTQLDGAGHGKPLAGAAISGAGVSAVTGRGGTVTVVPRRTGIVALQAEKSGATPSDPAYVCVYATHASDCGSSGLNGPAVHVIGIAERQVFTHGPRELHGTAGPDPSGLIDVSLSLARRAANGRCSVYDAARGSWRTANCSAGAPAFSVGADDAWSYLLPAALKPGSYRLQVIARDGSGRQTKVVSGVSRLDFTVGGTARQATTARAAPAVQMMVVGRTHTLISARSERLRGGTARIGARRCAVPSATPLAGLLAARLALRVSDAAGCDPTALFVSQIGPDHNRGIAGWQYKIGHASPSFGAGDPGQRLRPGAQLLWFWCVRATACQRTLALRQTMPAVPAPAAAFTVTVLGYDDNGNARPVSGATVRLGGEAVMSGTGGIATLTAPSQPGRYAITAVKSGLVPSFALEALVR